MQVATPVPPESADPANILDVSALEAQTPSGLETESEMGRSSGYAASAEGWHEITSRKHPRQVPTMPAPHPQPLPSTAAAAAGLPAQQLPAGNEQAPVPSDPAALLPARHQVGPWLLRR